MKSPCLLLSVFLSLALLSTASGQLQDPRILTADDGVANDRFGHSISVDGGAALFGAYNRNEDAVDSGVGYVFRFDATSFRL